MSQTQGLSIHTERHKEDSSKSLRDISWIRKQFPALAKKVNGRPIVFFDGPGGSQVTQGVVDAVQDYLINSNGNTGASALTSQNTELLVEAARTAIADLLNCNSDEIIFGANMTSLTFAVSRALGRNLVPGDEIVVTALDHDANVDPWLALAERGVIIRTVGVHLEDCTLDMEDLVSKINARTKIVAAGYASNAVGTINDVKEIVRLAHSVGALAYIDAVHYAPHGPIDVQALDCDFLGCAPYKFFAPHSGAVFGKKALLEKFHPYKTRSAPEHGPKCWETGTKSFEALAGIVAAIDYLSQLGSQHISADGNRRQALRSSMAAIKSYERRLGEHLVQGLLKIPGLILYGIADYRQFDKRTSTVGFNIRGCKPNEVTTYLLDQGIFSWSGNFCALGLVEKLGLIESGGMVRLGLVHYNTIDEVERLLETLHNFVKEI